MTLLCLFVLAVIRLVPLHLFICDHFRPQIQVSSGIPFASHTKQNYVMIYPMYIQGSYLAVAAAAEGGGGWGGLSWQIYAGGWR